MVKDTLNIALVQMTSVDSVNSNLSKIESIINSLKKIQKDQNQTLDLVCFPENCLFLRIKNTDPIEGFELSHSAFERLKEWAQKINATLHLGSVPLVLNGNLYNSSVWISDEGQIQVGYQKIHLFDISLEGQTPIRESEVYKRGDAPRWTDFKGWRIGETICYDLRFSELFSKYAYQNVDLVLAPAAFLEETGQAHWEVLLRARAIESQCYIAASAQSGVHQSVQYPLVRNTFGHSLIVDPWGKVDINLGRQESVQIHTIHKEKIKKVRIQMPMASHRQGRG